MFLTRCPHCRTTFRLTDAQLTARGGRVRCGACKQVFNARENLLGAPSPAPVSPQAAEEALTRTLILLPETGDDAPLPAFPSPSRVSAAAPRVGATKKTPPAAATREEAAPGVAASSKSSADALRSSGSPPAAPDVTPVPQDPWAQLAAKNAAARREALSKAVEEQRQQESAENVRQQTLAAGLSAPRHTQELPGYSPWSSSMLEPQGGETSYPRWPFVLLAALLALILAGQAAYHYRVELSRRFPVAAQISRALKLSLPLPRERQRILLEELDMQPEIETAGPEAQPRLRVLLTLRNEAPYPLAWPHLELTLSDVQGALLVRRTLAPKDYLPSGFPGGLPPGNTPIHLLLDKGALPVVSYQIDPFYP